MSPEDVSGVIGDTRYRLVYMNACLAANTADPESRGDDFITAFNTDAYVGFSGSTNAAQAAYAAYDFFSGLQMVKFKYGSTLKMESFLVVIVNNSQTKVVKCESF